MKTLKCGETAKDDILHMLEDSRLSQSFVHRLLGLCAWRRIAHEELPRRDLPTACEPYPLRIRLGWSKTRQPVVIVLKALRKKIGLHGVPVA